MAKTLASGEVGDGWNRRDRPGARERGGESGIRTEPNSWGSSRTLRRDGDQRESGNDEVQDRPSVEGVDSAGRCGSQRIIVQLHHSGVLWGIHATNRYLS